MIGPALKKMSGSPRKRAEQSFASVSALIPLSVSLMIAGCDFPGRPDPADRPVSADRVLDFAQLYGQNCAGCHGADGKLGPAPPLNDPLFRQIVPEAELESVVTNGRNKTLMPAFAKENGGPLTSAQIQIFVHEIKGRPYRVIEKPESATVEVVTHAEGMSPKWGSPGQPPAGAPSYLQPSIDGTENSTTREVASMSVFARACADCHGDHGQGIARGETLIQTINDPAFLSLCSDQVLRRYVITGRADLGMPGYANARPGSLKFQPLTDDDVASLVALLASWREKEFASGQIQTSKN
jgi:mono/diheme cytochrome c family protein